MQDLYPLQKEKKIKKQRKGLGGQTRANSADLHEVAHHEPPHKDQRCLQIQLFSSLVVKELTVY